MTQAFGTLEPFVVLDILLLLLIGIGPKVAIVPFLVETAGMDSETRRAVAKTMTRTAVGWRCSSWPSARC
jgi:multiple antibiotic resistance protein